MNGTGYDPEDIHRYDDIIDMPRPDLQRHDRMPVSDRAAQFKPFAALTGYADVIREVSRETESMIILDDQEKALINRRLMTIQKNIGKQPRLEITYFVQDEHKSGGRYLTARGEAERIDIFEKILIMQNGLKIRFGEIVRLEILPEAAFGKHDGNQDL